MDRLDTLEARLAKPGPPLEPVSLRPLDTHEVESQVEFSTTQETFEDWVSSIRDYILQGDVMQVVPSQRMTAPFTQSPLTLYRALRNLNPSPYLYFVDLGGFQIVGSSPEILVRLEGGEVTVRPIAGTRKRGTSAEEDEALEADLLSDRKEIAEHLMLIDLGRNDVGRVAKAGSVALTEQMVVERYSHVMHIVSNVTAAVRDDILAIDALKATLPAGTLSGAPKLRAMEIIDELEPVKRGIYGGAVGYVSWAGEMDTAIAIRTALIMDQRVIVQAGAGVVADSIPTSEWEETLNKARAMLRAIAMCGERDKYATPNAPSPAGVSLILRNLRVNHAFLLCDTHDFKTLRFRAPFKRDVIDLPSTRAPSMEILMPPQAEYCRPAQFNHIAGAQISFIKTRRRI